MKQHSLPKQLIVLTIIISAMICGCTYKSFYGNRPVDQPGSVWVSTDGSITFVVDENGAGDGTMTVDGNEYAIYFGVGPGVEISIYSAETNENGVYDKLLEEWTGDFDVPERFRATVVETTYFSQGETIEFVRIVEGDRHEHPAS